MQAKRHQRHPAATRSLPAWPPMDKWWRVTWRRSRPIIREVCSTRAFYSTEHVQLKQFIFAISSTINFIVRSKALRNTGTIPSILSWPPSKAPPGGQAGAEATSTNQRWNSVKARVVCAASIPANQSGWHHGKGRHTHVSNWDCIEFILASRGARFSFPVETMHWARGLKELNNFFLLRIRSVRLFKLMAVRSASLRIVFYCIGSCKPDRHSPCICSESNKDLFTRQGETWFLKTAQWARHTNCYNCWLFWTSFCCCFFYCGAWQIKTKLLKGGEGGGGDIKVVTCHVRRSLEKQQKNVKHLPCFLHQF